MIFAESKSLIISVLHNIEKYFANYYEFGKKFDVKIVNIFIKVYKKIRILKI
jgi:hypothetical protein